VFFINLPIAKLMYETAYLAITYCKRVHNYLGTSEDQHFECSSVRQLRYLDFIILIWEKASSQWWQINFDKQHQTTVIGQQWATIDCWPPLALSMHRLGYRLDHSEITSKSKIFFSSLHQASD